MNKTEMARRILRRFEQLDCEANDDIEGYPDSFERAHGEVMKYGKAISDVREFIRKQVGRRKL